MGEADNHDRCEFRGSSGDELAARVDRPDGETRGWALFAHCFTCGKDLASAGAIQRALNSEGIAIMRFDFTGLGHSGGEFENTNFSSNVDDLVHAAEFMTSHYGAPDILIGHSLGGSAVLAAACEINTAAAVATIGAPADPDHVAGLFAGSEDEIESEGEATVLLEGREFTVRKQFLEDIRSQNLLPKVGEIDQALLVFHSPIDQTVGIDNARRIFDAAKHPKSFVTLDTADHLLSDRSDATYVGDVLAAWSARYI